MDFLIQILSKCERLKNASRAKKINTSQDLSRLNVRRIIILLPTLVIINMKLIEKSWSYSIIRKFVSFWSYINNCDRHLSWEMCSKPLKKHSNQKEAVLNLCDVIIYNIVDGLSKLPCDPLPYLKTKKNDLITTYAKWGTTTVHYCCTTMPFVYFLSVWVINLDKCRKSYERECISWFMGTSDVLKVLKIARAVGDCNLRTFKTSRATNSLSLNFFVLAARAFWYPWVGDLTS